MAKEQAKNKEYPVLSLFKYDITTFFQSDIKEIWSEDTPAVQIVEYELKLQEFEFGLFDTLRMRVMFDKDNILADTHVNLSLKIRRKRATVDDTKSVLEMLSAMLGPDDFSNRFDNDDEFAESVRSFKLDYRWSMDCESFVCLNYREITGLELNILFVNNLLKNSGKKFDI